MAAILAKVCSGVQYRRAKRGHRLYQIERRDASADGWTLVSVSFEPQIRLADQPRVSWEYRVLACNKSGPSPPSNTITAVL